MHLRFTYFFSVWIDSSLILLLINSPLFPSSLIGQLLKNPLAMQETLVWSLIGKIGWRRDRWPNPVFLGFPWGSAGKKSTCNAGDLSSIPGLGKSPGEGKGYPLRYSGLENSMDCIVQRISKSQTRLSNFHFHFTFLLHPLKDILFLN